VEPVCGIIQHVIGFRQLSMRGLKKVSGESTLATLAWNVKRMNVLIMAGNALAEIIMRQPVTDVYSDSHMTYFILKLCQLNVSPTNC
jgi:hypothetical protein